MSRGLNRLRDYDRRRRDLDDRDWRTYERLERERVLRPPRTRAATLTLPTPPDALTAEERAAHVAEARTEGRLVRAQAIAAGFITPGNGYRGPGEA